MKKELLFVFETNTMIFYATQLPLVLLRRFKERVATESDISITVVMEDSAAFLKLLVLKLA